MELWTKDQILKKYESGERGVLFLHTPFCGTCQLAEKMIRVVEQLLPDMVIGKADINYLPDLAERFRISSVPCLLIFEHQEIQNKIYAFPSVLDIYEQLKS
mgnify:CR=1 FL=1